MHGCKFRQVVFKKSVRYTYTLVFHEMQSSRKEIILSEAAIYNDVELDEIPYGFCMNKPCMVVSSEGQMN